MKTNEEIPVTLKTVPMKNFKQQCKLISTIMKLLPKTKITILLLMIAVKKIYNQIAFPVYGIIHIQEIQCYWEPVVSY